MMPPTKLPDTLPGVLVGRDGRPVGLDLPSLDERGAADAWRHVLGTGPYYVRFLDRDNPPPLAWVRRVAHLGEVWIDGAVPDVDHALELLIAGAARLVLWTPSEELLDAVSDSGVYGWDGSEPLAAASDRAEPHLVPIVCAVPTPDRGDAGLYQLPPQPWTGRIQVPYVGTPVADEAAE